MSEVTQETPLTLTRERLIALTDYAVALTPHPENATEVLKGAEALKEWALQAVNEDDLSNRMAGLNWQWSNVKGLLPGGVMTAEAFIEQADTYREFIKTLPLSRRELLWRQQEQQSAA